jgi:enoyl-CoA hydratase/carnithine racemase
VKKSIEYETHAPVFGDPLIVVDLRTETPPERRPPGSILLGIDGDGRLPKDISAEFDLLLTTAPSSPRPWVGVGKQTVDSALASIQNSVRARPLAASTLVQVLQAGARLPFVEALAVESFAYSTLLGGIEFRNWRQTHPPAATGEDSDERIRFTRDGGTVSIELANAGRHNAIDARMRDALSEAFNAVLDDPSAKALRLSGAGRAFSVGGELEEFGTTPDLATAHAVRSLRSPALLLHLMRAKATVFVHGACIGSGIEIPAAAGRIVANPDSWFSLPEVSMGLIPGAGGTVTISARIGRHRTLYWALVNRKLNAAEALEWGLVDEVGTAP